MNQKHLRVLVEGNLMRECLMGRVKIGAPVTMLYACSAFRRRWPVFVEGFPHLFSTKAKAMEFFKALAFDDTKKVWAAPAWKNVRPRQRYTTFWSNGLAIAVEGAWLSDAINLEFWNKQPEGRLVFFETGSTDLDWSYNPANKKWEKI